MSEPINIPKPPDDAPKRLFPIRPASEAAKEPPARRERRKMLIWWWLLLLFGVAVAVAFFVSEARD